MYDGKDVDFDSQESIVIPIYEKLIDLSKSLNEKKDLSLKQDLVKNFLIENKLPECVVLALNSLFDVRFDFSKHFHNHLDTNYEYAERYAKIFNMLAIFEIVTMEKIYNIKVVS